MIKSALSVLALTVAFSGAAFAQGMMINGVAVSEADQPAVQQRCDQLANASSTESLALTTEDGEVTGGMGADTNGASSTTAGDAAAAKLPYYDRVLVLFGRGWLDNRYRFSADGLLQPAWRTQCSA